ncbi:hypothetical protein PsorP6_001307 [Peronosclerospora sorghi]|uniref:Uncharacterized protein n=1 Tax=Peronosclerospora sorghi TaxID=230839 RepID=A0ACC0WRE6_9STRA|nr:hypothetical protein PsorP6_001307 [Peronosclerospora sorghi]
MDALPDMTLLEDHIVQGDEMVEAIQALIEEGESAESLALHWKNQGNDMFSDAKKAHRGYYKNAMKYYNDALANESIKYTIVVIQRKDQSHAAWKHWMFRGIINERNEGLSPCLPLKK